MEQADMPYMAQVLCYHEHLKYINGVMTTISQCRIINPWV
jgi:hypothetical protein